MKNVRPPSTAITNGIVDWDTASAVVGVASQPATLPLPDIEHNGSDSDQGDSDRKLSGEFVFAESQPNTSVAATTPKLRIVMMPVDAIKIGKRIRIDLGDIEALAQNITAVGLLHPPTVARDGTLLIGARRLAVVKKLGWKEIFVFVKDGANDNAV
jgi:hypothetical protein